MLLGFQLSELIYLSPKGSSFASEKQLFFSQLSDFAVFGNFQGWQGSLWVGLRALLPVRQSRPLATLRQLSEERKCKGQGCRVGVLWGQASLTLFLRQTTRASMSYTPSYGLLDLMGPLKPERCKQEKNYKVLPVQTHSCIELNREKRRFQGKNSSL